MPDVFLSYNREDQATARWFADGLAAEGFDVWWDVTLRSGEAYDEVTETALRTAKAVVVLWSKKSVASRWVRAEATLAHRNKTLAPVMIEACDRPIMFELIQTADLTHWRGERDDRAWHAFAEDVGRLVRGERNAETPETAPATPAPRRSRRGDVPSLAVMPFTNRSGLPEDEVFAFGMGEDIIDALSQGVDVRMIASSATARFRRGGAPDLPAMARELGVRYVLEGNVRRVGENLRVTTQLLETARGTIVWSQKFDRPLEQLAKLQEQLVLEVAARLRTQSHRLEIERALRKPNDLTAWEAVMRCIAAYRTLTGAALLTGLAEARKAVEIAPDYALAIVLVAEAESIIYYQFAPEDPAEARRIRSGADRAAKLDPDNAVVMSTVATTYTLLGFPEDALAAGRRAIQLNPNNEFGYHPCGVACVLLDRCDEALAYFDRERELAPDHPVIWTSYVWRAAAHMRRSDWAAGAEAYDEALRLTPDNAFPYIGKAICLAYLGRRKETPPLMAKARELEPGTPLPLWELRMSRGWCGSDSMPEILRYLRELWADAEAPVA